MVKKILHLIGNTTSPNNYPISAEYIKPLGKINITSHGIGSGIYGLSRSKYNSYFDNLPEYLKDGTYVEVIINNPFILKNSEDCDKLIAWSTELNNNLVDKIRIPGFLYVRGFLLKHPPIFTKEYNQWKIDNCIVSYKAKSSHIGK